MGIIYNNKLVLLINKNMNKEKIEEILNDYRQGIVKRGKSKWESSEIRDYSTLEKDLIINILEAILED